MKSTFSVFHCIGLILLFCLSIAQADAPSATTEKTKTCFQCNGLGKTICPAPTCRGGQADCPGACLKLTKGSWVHLEVPGHPPTDIWQKFSKPDGGWTAYNQNHVGHIIQMRNGQPTDVGACPICKGSTKVTCPVCKGTGEAVCSLCDGKKVVPVSWTAFDNPKMKNRPSHFKMKDGTTIVGRKTIVMGNDVTIRTEKGNVEVNAADIIDEEKPAGR